MTVFPEIQPTIKTVDYPLEKVWCAVADNLYSDVQFYVQLDAYLDPTPMMTANGALYCDLGRRTIIQPNGQHISLGARVGNGYFCAPLFITARGHNEAPYRIQAAELANYAMGRPLDAPNYWGQITRNTSKFNWYSRKYGRRRRA